MRPLGCRLRHCGRPRRRPRCQRPGPCNRTRRVCRADPCGWDERRGAVTPTWSLHQGPRHGDACRSARRSGRPGRRRVPSRRQSRRASLGRRYPGASAPKGVRRHLSGLGDGRLGDADHVGIYGQDLVFCLPGARRRLARMARARARIIRVRSRVVVLEARPAPFNFSMPLAILATPLAKRPESVG